MVINEPGDQDCNTEDDEEYREHTPCGEIYVRAHISYGSFRKKRFFPQNKEANYSKQEYCRWVNSLEQEQAKRFLPERVVFFFRNARLAYGVFIHSFIIVQCNQFNPHQIPSFHTSIPTPRINSKITAQELRVISDTGENLGILSREKALALARPQDGVDLIEISPNAKPPVARLMSYDKFRYEEAKREKKERLAQKSAGMKRVQISARAAKNDLEIKMRQLEKFLSEGHQIEIHLRLRGREKGNKDWASQKLEEFLKMIPAEVEYKRISPPRFGGYGLSMQIGKK